MTCRTQDQSYPSRRQDGFSLLELVVAVSIMLILGIVGFVSYQAYADNARQAALETSANQVLTAVVAEHNTPTGDPVRAVEGFNATSDAIIADITSATAHSLTVQAMTCDGGIASATIPGDHRSVETTSYNDVSYSWSEENGHPISVMELCGKVVAKNYATNPRYAVHGGWHKNVNPVWSTTRAENITDHPLGITTAIESRLQDEYPPQYSGIYSMSLYHVGNLPASEDEFYAGVWVKTDTPGYAIISRALDPQPIEPHVWTFVTSGNQKVGGSNNHGEAIAGIRIIHDSVAEAEAATSWATGSVISYDAPVQAFFDGDTP